MTGTNLATVKTGKGTRVKVKPDRSAAANIHHLRKDGADRRQWTLKGIPPTAVDQTREAALRNGMKLNSFVTAALLRAVEDAVPDQASNQNRSPAEIEARIDLLESYIKKEFDALKKRNEEIESFMKNINGFFIRMYAEREK